MESTADLSNSLDQITITDPLNTPNLRNQETLSTSGDNLSNISDSLVIAYQDNFNIWPNVVHLFKHLTRFDLKLSRNLKLESLNDQLVLNKGSTGEDFRVAVKCVYTSLPSTNESHSCKVHCPPSKETKLSDQIYHGESNFEDKTPNNIKNKPQKCEEEISNVKDGKGEVVRGKEKTKVDTRGSEHLLRGKEEVMTGVSEHPYLFLFLIPPTTLSDYRKTVKPRMKEFISKRMENKLNEEFLIVAFVWSRGGNPPVDEKKRLKLGSLTMGKAREGEDRKVVEKVRMRLFKQKLRSRLVVVSIDSVVFEKTEDLDVTTIDKSENIENGNSNTPNNSIKPIDALVVRSIRESGIDKMMSSLINLSVNKRYLYILIHINKTFLSFMAANTTPSKMGNVVNESGVNTFCEGGLGNSNESTSINDTSSAIKTVSTVHSTGKTNNSLGMLTVGSYLTFVEAVETLCNLFYKLQLTLDSIFLYEFLLYNENFGKLLSLFKATTVEESFYTRFNPLNSYSSPYYSTLGTMDGNGLTKDDVNSSSERYCYVRYRLYILSKQLLMLNTINPATSTADRVSDISRVSTMSRVSGGSRTSRRTTSGPVGVASLPSNSNVTPTTTGGDSVLFLTVLLIYNFINDVYFQVIGTPSTNRIANTATPVGTSSSPLSTNVTNVPSGLTTNASTNTTTGGTTNTIKIKWVMLIILELIRHIENKLNAEFSDDDTTNESYYGEVVGMKKKKFRFLKSLFGPHTIGISSRVSHTSRSRVTDTISRNSAGIRKSGSVTTAACSITANNSIAKLVRSYYGIKQTENVYKYVSFIYLVLYKLTLQLSARTANVTGDEEASSAKVGVGESLGSMATKATDATTSLSGSSRVGVAGTSRDGETRRAGPFGSNAQDEDGLDLYIESVYNNCLRLHYDNITETPVHSDQLGGRSVMENIDELLDQIVAYKVAIIERCSKYFILSNLESYSNVLKSYYLNRSSSSSLLGVNVADFTTRLGDRDRGGSFSGLDLDNCRSSFTSHGLTRTDRPLDATTTNTTSIITETSRTATTDRTTSTLADTTSIGSVSDGGDKAGKKPEKLGSMGSIGSTRYLETSKHPTNIKYLEDSNEIATNDQMEVVCTANRCNEYDHLYSKNLKRPSSGTLSLYPSCYNYIHIYLANRAGVWLEEVFLHLTSTSGEGSTSGVGSSTSTSGKGKMRASMGGSTYRGEGSQLSINLDELTVINIDNKVVNISLFNNSLSRTKLSRGTESASSAISSTLNGGKTNGFGSDGNFDGGIKLPGFSNKMILCVPLKLCDDIVDISRRNRGGDDVLGVGSGMDQEGLRFNITVTTAPNNRSSIDDITTATDDTTQVCTDPATSTITGTSDVVKGTKTYLVRIRDIFDVKLSDGKGLKNIYLRVQYRDLVKIHQIYLNNNIMAGTTLLDYNSIYKIAYQPTHSVNSTTTNTPTNRSILSNSSSFRSTNSIDSVDATRTDSTITTGSSNTTSDGSVTTTRGIGTSNGDTEGGEVVETADGGEDTIKIYYSLYRKYRSSLQQLTHNQLYLIYPATLKSTNEKDYESGRGNDGDREEDEEEFVVSREDFVIGREEQIKRVEQAKTSSDVELTLKVPGYAFVSKGITMSIWLVSNATVTFSYSIENNHNWFIEGLVVNNNVVLTKGKKYGLQFRLIPLREGRLEVPTVRFRGLKVEVPRRDVTVFPANYLLL